MHYFPAICHRLSLLVAMTSSGTYICSSPKGKNTHVHYSQAPLSNSVQKLPSFYCLALNGWNTANVLPTSSLFSSAQVVVGTPGRLADLLTRADCPLASAVKTLVRCFVGLKEKEVGREVSENILSIGGSSSG